MASLKKRNTTNMWRLRFTLGGDTREITFKASQLDAQRMKKIVEYRDEQIYTGDPSKEMEKLIKELPVHLREKLKRNNVTDMGGKQTIGELIEAYKRANANVKENTLKARQGTYNNILQHFGEATLIQNVTPQNADEFYMWMQRGSRRNGAKNTLRPGTYQRRIKTVKSIFALAVRYEWIDKNPFQHIKGGSSTSSERQFFIPPDAALKIYDACPNTYWRLVWAFARWGGLRMRSEFPLIKWEDINWAEMKITIHEPKKTGRDEELKTRVMPLFPELKTVLEEAWEQSKAGDVYITDFYTRGKYQKKKIIPRDGRWNPTTHLLRIIKQAGIAPWVKLLQNCRSTRETELVEEYPIHAVAAWLGNSPKVAMKYYLQLHEGHFAQAVQGKSLLQPDTPPAEPPSGIPSDAACEPFSETKIPSEAD